MIVPESKIDDLERALKQKIESLSGYGDSTSMARKLSALFKFFDLNQNGVIEYNEFFAGMVRLNFVAMTREIEALFDRYDENGDGHLDYKELASHIFGVDGSKPIEGHMVGIVDKIKTAIFENGGANGIRSLKRIMKRMDGNKNNMLEREELVDGFAEIGLRLNTRPGGDVDKIMDYFDVDGDGHISISEFMRGIRGQMPKHRKDLVRLAFNRLDRTGDGEVTIEDIKDVYDTDFHPDVINGRMTKEAVLEDILSVYEGTSRDKDGIITWPEFLDYYRDISAGIEEDSYFELMIRNAWHLHGGQGEGANSANLRVCATFKDGRTEVVTVEDDLGLKATDGEAVIKRLEKQGLSGIVKVSLGME